MTDKELSDYLDVKKSAVVHLSLYSHTGKDRPLYPDDLHRAIERRAEFPLSCVVVWPGHGMVLPGSVGVIFKPTCANVVSTSNEDSGSYYPGNGPDLSAGQPLSAEALASTFEVVKDHNEWRVRGAEVFGIFVANPSFIQVKAKQIVEMDGTKYEDHGFAYPSLDDVFAAFPGQRIFTMGPAGLKELTQADHGSD